MNGKTSEIPATFSSDWIDHLDGRTKLARVVRQRLSSLHSDLGGRDALSYQQRSLCRRAVWLEALIERREVALANGREIDEGAHTQSINALMGVWKALGLQRKAREVPDLHDYLRNREGASA